jgi:hypothetical protein
VSTGGFIITYLSLCVSKYQLPHYILVAFPLAAVIVGKLLNDFIATDHYPRLRRAFAGIQTGVTAALMAGALLIITYVFPAGPIGIMLWLLSAVIWIFSLVRFKSGYRVLWISVITMILINFFVTNYFYYPLLKYQVGSTVGSTIRKLNIPPGNLLAWRVLDPLDAIHYYANRVVRKSSDLPPPAFPGDYLVTMESELPVLDSLGKPYDIIKKGRFFKVSELTPEFLNPATRNAATKPWVFIRLK